MQDEAAEVALAQLLSGGNTPKEKQRPAGSVPRLPSRPARPGRNEEGWLGRGCKLGGQKSRHWWGLALVSPGQGRGPSSLLSPATKVAEPPRLPMSNFSRVVRRSQIMSFPNV